MFRPLINIGKRRSAGNRELESVLGVSSNQNVHKKPRQDPHELAKAQVKRCFEVCRQLLDIPLNDQFWKLIVTSDEKWAYLVNHNR